MHDAMNLTNGRSTRASFRDPSSTRYMSIVIAPSSHMLLIAV